MSRMAIRVSLLCPLRNHQCLKSDEDYMRFRPSSSRCSSTSDSSYQRMNRKLGKCFTFLLRELSKQLSTTFRRTFANVMVPQIEGDERHVMLPLKVIKLTEEWSNIAKD